MGPRGGRCGEGRGEPGPFGSFSRTESCFPRVRGLGLQGCRGSCWQAELQVRVAGEPPALALVPRRCRQAGGPLQQRSEPGPASSISPCIAGAEAVWSWGRGQCNHPEPFPVENSWPGELLCECYMLAVARSWGCFCAGEVGAGVSAGGTPGLRSTASSSGVRAAGRELSCCYQTTDGNQVTATGRWGEREEGPSPARSRAHIFQPLQQPGGSLGTAGTCAQPATPGAGCSGCTGPWSPPGGGAHV